MQDNNPPQHQRPCRIEIQSSNVRVASSHPDTVEEIAAKAKTLKLRIEGLKEIAVQRVSNALNTAENAKGKVDPGILDAYVAELEASLRRLNAVDWPPRR